MKKTKRPSIMSQPQYPAWTLLLGTIYAAAYQHITEFWQGLLMTSLLLIGLVLCCMTTIDHELFNQPKND